VQKKPFSSKSGIFKAPEGELKAPEDLSEKVFFVLNKAYRTSVLFLDTFFILSGGVGLVRFCLFDTLIKKSLALGVVL